MNKIPAFLFATTLLALGIAAGCGACSKETKEQPSQGEQAPSFIDKLTGQSPQKLLTFKELRENMVAYQIEDRDVQDQRR